MNQSERTHAFVEFTVQDEAALNRLVSVVDELGRQKRGASNREDAHWLPYFDGQDRTAFWWPSETEMKDWNTFWFSMPLPQRHSPEMPIPPWDFGSMIEAILEGDYDLIGVTQVRERLARLEIDPHAYPYGGIDSLRALVRSFGHTILSFDDGTGVTSGDPQRPRWNGQSQPNPPTKRCKRRRNPALRRIGQA